MTDRKLTGGYKTPTNVWVAFFILMSLTTSIGFIYTWSALDLFLAAMFNIIATVIKYRDKKRSPLGEICLGAGIVADLHLIPACILIITTGAYATQLSPGSFYTLGAVGFAIGAVAANIVSVIILLLSEALDYPYLRKAGNIIDGERQIQEHVRFVLDPPYKKYLKEGKIDKNLKEPFDREALPLSSDAKITPEGRKKWQIKDDNVTYTVKEEDDELNVYKGLK